MNAEEQTLQAAMAALNARKIDDAERLFRKVVQAQPEHVAALNLLTVVLMSTGRFAEAEEFIERAVTLNQRSDVYFYNYGLILKHLGKTAQAKSQFDRALELNPGAYETWNNRGAVFNDLKQYDLAVSDFDKAISLNPKYHIAFCNKAKSLLELRRYEEALAACDSALALKPDLAEAWLGCGNVLGELGRYNEACAAYAKAVALNPGMAEAWIGSGNVFAELKRYDEAVAAYDRGLALRPDLAAAEGARLLCKLHLCDWHDLAAGCERLVASIKSDGASVDPFALVAISTSREDQLRCATLRIDDKFPASDRPHRKGDVYTHDKIRVGYVSADFHQHATSHLMAGLFECHDKTQFQVTAISTGPDDGSELRDRLKKSFDYFLDYSALSDDAIADRIREREIDILVDLKGFTQHARTGIFARRAAPLQVSYLGFPGTMGAGYIDYMIADGTLVPQSHQKDYREKIIYLPDSYQVNDAKRAIAAKGFSRRDVGLNDENFVFCCFNSGYKILPATFDCWMGILKQVDGSVLWLLESNATAAGNLRKEAGRRGVDPGRLVFAPRMPPPDHLARHRCADLFLDTLPYNAHTTASDALWSGLPVLTQIGETFAGRVAASLLKAAGLPELIVPTPQDYERLAVELAASPGRLAAIRRKLAETRSRAPLFDTPLTTRHIERAYRAIHERFQAGLPPDHVYISPNP
jgi:predicted O-linked N-acetylglucosamine transferase (SPINDLY family)